MESKNYTHTLKEIIDYEPSKIIKRGNYILLLILLLLFLLAYFVKLPITIDTDAILTSNPPPEKIFSNRTSKIDTIFVTDNSYIQENTRILLLENTANYSDVIFLKSRIKKFNITADTLSFHIENMPFLMLGEVQQYYSSFERLYLEYVHASNFNTTRIAKESNISNARILSERLKTLNLSLRLERKKQAILLRDKNRAKSLLDKGVISIQDYEKNSLKEFQGQQNIQSIKTEISELNNEIENSDKDIKINTASIERSSQSINKSMIHAFNRLKVELNNWEKNYVVKSTTSGIFTFNKYFNVQEIIDSKTLIGTTIVKDEMKPIVHLYAPIENSGKLKIGQQVNIKFDNYNYIEYGIVYATITHISSMTNHEQNYLIKAKLTNGLTTSYNKELPFKNDITGKATIIVDNTSILERIFFQFKDILYNR
jgi:hypothetical protein